jgi:hypothetical protein
MTDRTIAYAEMSTEDLWQERRRLAALSNPAMMGRYLDPTHFHARAHTRLIGKTLACLGPGAVERLLVMTPPQVGKSTLVSEYMPFWWLTKHPRDRLVVGSYAASLAVKKSKRVRDLVREHGHKFEMRLQPGDQASDDWSLTTGGGMRAAGVGGALTGFPGNVGLVDDPHKDRKEAESKVFREAVWDWWSSTMLSRLSPDAPVVLVLTRWHEKDLAGRLLAQEGRASEGGKWYVLHLPAFATSPDDPLGRAVGDPLTHPKLADADTAALRRHWETKRSGSTVRDWGSLYQGDPKPREGALLSAAQVEGQRYFLHIVEPVRKAVAVDPSGGGKDEAGIIAGFLGSDQRVYFTHDRSGVMPSTEWARKACILAYETGATVIYVEKNFGGDLSLIPIAGAWDQLQREGVIDKHALKPWIEPKTAKTGKFIRAEPIAQAWLEDRVRTWSHMTELEDEWETYQPGVPDSPGRLDASVYLVYGLLQLPGSDQHIGNAAGVSISQAAGQAQQAPSGGLGSISLGRR